MTLSQQTYVPVRGLWMMCGRSTQLAQEQKAGKGVGEMIGAD
jgi:hypothetical protein